MIIQCGLNWPEKNGANNQTEYQFWLNYQIKNDLTDDYEMTC